MSNTRDQFATAAAAALLKARGHELLLLAKTDPAEWQRACGEIMQAAGVMADAMVAASSDPPDAPQ
jgi:hypothetical protein